jgi:LacI family transcriptional regulator
VRSAEGGLDFSSGLNAFNQLHADGFKPTVIIYANDESAAGAIHAAHLGGWSLPEDLSIVSFDDAPFAKLLPPLLTTMLNRST